MRFSIRCYNEQFVQSPEVHLSVNLACMTFFSFFNNILGCKIYPTSYLFGFLINLNIFMVKDHPENWEN